MNLGSPPAKFPIPWANGAGGSYIRAIPVASQIGITPGAASLTDGFPPLTFDPPGSGGVPPFGQDENGILNQITAWLQRVAAGNPILYDGTYSTDIGGYPRGALLASTADIDSLWLNTVDGNTNNPDVTPTGWEKLGPTMPLGGDLSGTIAAAVINAGVVIGSMIANNTVANANLAQAPKQTMKGNPTGATANEIDMTVSQILSMLGLTGGASFTNPGYITVPTPIGPAYIQFGVTAPIAPTSGATTITLPFTFPNAALGGAATNQGTANAVWSRIAAPLTTSTITLINTDAFSSGSSAGYPIFWIAIGY